MPQNNIPWKDENERFLENVEREGEAAQKFVEAIKDFEQKHRQVNSDNDLISKVRKYARNNALGFKIEDKEELEKHILGCNVCMNYVIETKFFYETLKATE